MANAPKPKPVGHARDFWFSHGNGYRGEAVAFVYAPSLERTGIPG